MFTQEVAFLLNIIMLLDAIIVIISGFLSYYIFFDVIKNYKIELLSSFLIYTIIFLIFINNFVMAQVGFYSSRRPHSFREVVQKLVIAVGLDICLLTAGYYFTHIYVPPRFLILYGTILFVFLFLEKVGIELFLIKRQKKGVNVRRILLVGNDKRIKYVNDALRDQRSWGHKVVGFLTVTENDISEGGLSSFSDIPYLGTLAKFKDILITEIIDEVIFCLSNKYSKFNVRPYLDICHKAGISYRIVPAMYSPKSGEHFMLEKIQQIPTLVMLTHNINVSGLLYKRVLDIFVGLIGCFILLFLYPIVGLAIKLDSEGPVIFKQKRVGMNGRIFTLYKFRTMYKDAEERKKELMKKNIMKGQIFKIKDDPRITRVGRFLRKTSLDEFPQFINVLLGQMSVVGTRPPTPDEVREYELWHLKRICIKPGITGLWQISGRNEITDFNEIVKLDLKYIENWRFLDDIYIILKTIIVVLKRKGAV